jgi:GNAT superfamily N-acetyltransferase
MMDVATFEKIETLKDGTIARFRSVRAEDKEKFSEAFRNLEPESVYTRFFHHKKMLTDADLKAATEVDFENVVALVATVGEGEGEVIIAGGRYVVLEPGSPQRVAEVAFTVEEDYHRQGIASRLLQYLTGIAREKGLSRLEAEVLPENKAMIGVFERSGLPMKRKIAGGAMHITLSLEK